MIEVLFSRLQYLTNKLSRLANHTVQNTFGDGMIGSWYVAVEDDQFNPPDSFQKILLHEPGGHANMPFLNTYTFENLTIDEGAVLRFQGDCAVIRVKETLRLDGHIELANCHPGNQYYTNGVGMRNAANIRTYEHMMGSTNILPDIGFMATGGGLSSGNFVAYYNTITNEHNVKMNNVDLSNYVIRTDGTSAGGGLAGGYLVILAKKMMLGDNAKFDVHGGDGQADTASGRVYTYQIKEIDL